MVPQQVQLQLEKLKVGGEGWGGVGAMEVTGGVFIHLVGDWAGMT